MASAAITTAAITTAVIIYSRFVGTGVLIGFFMSAPLADAGLERLYVLILIISRSESRS